MTCKFVVEMTYIVYINQLKRHNLKFMCTDDIGYCTTVQFIRLFVH